MKKWDKEGLKAQLKQHQAADEGASCEAGGPPIEGLESNGRGNLLAAALRWKQSEHLLLARKVDAEIFPGRGKRKAVKNANQERIAAAQALFNILQDFEEPTEWPS